MRLPFLLAGLAALVATAYAPAPEPASPDLAPADTTWSWPEAPENLQVLPEDIGASNLRDVMRSFTRALGVRCVECHVGEEGADFLTWDFASDAKPDKEVAREMMRMSFAINRETLPAIWDQTGHQPAEVEGFRVSCWTCHRGEKVPENQPPPRER